MSLESLYSLITMNFFTHTDRTGLGLEKGQSAIEYLMTYGWMLLVVAIVGGAIFSIAQSQNVESVSGFTGGDVQVESFGITSNDELEMVLRNADSNTLTIEEVRVSDESNTAEWIDEESIGVGDTGSITLQEVGEGGGADTLDVEVIYSSGGLSDLQVEGTISGNFEVIEDSTALAADFGFSPTGPEPGETVSFDASGSSGEITSYDWYFDDGDTGTGETVDHSFSDEDDYSVELTVEDEEGNSDSSESVVSVSSVDPASFDLTDDGDNSPVVEGENFEVSYTVENSGEESDTQDIILEVDGVQEDSVSHNLDSGESESDTLVWSTEEGDNGDDIDYTVYSSDDSFLGSVNVEEVATAGLSGLDVAGQGSDATVDEGEAGDVTVDVENVGDESGSFSVDLSIVNGESVSDTESTSSLDSGQSETVTFTDPISGLSADSYGVDVEVSGDDSVSGSLTVEEDTEPVSSSGAPSFSTSTGDEDTWVPVAPDSGTDQGFSHFFDETGDPEYFSEEEGFYVMKYEAKAYDEGDSFVSDGGGSNSDDWADESIVPRSVADYEPWREISFNEGSPDTGYGAVQACEALNDDPDIGDDYEFGLVTNREWMTVARQVEQTDGNWLDGEVDSDGQLIRGNSDGDDPYNASTDDSDGFYQLDSGEIEGDFNERTFELANGEVVWDWAGNVRQWTYAEDGGGSTTNGVFDEDDPSGLEYEKDPAVVDRSTDGVGSDFGFDDDQAAIRGGHWIHGVSAGVFRATSLTPDDSRSRYGFRCSAVPVS